MCQIMHFFRRSGAPLVVVIVLVVLFIFAFISLGEGFKFLVTRKEAVTLRNRGGTTVTFSLPWKSSFENPSKAKVLSPALGGLLGDVTNVASANLDDGSNISGSVAPQDNTLHFKDVADGPTTQVSVVFEGGPAIVASILSEVNGIVNDATGIIGGVVGDAPGVIGMITSTASGQLTSSMNTSSSWSQAQGFQTQSRSTTAVTAAISALNITTTATLPSTPSTSSTLVTAPCLAMATTTTTITPCCPDPTAVTRTVTETWHSTHYESTQTLYSFMSVFTVTCTETISVYPPMNSYIFTNNITISSLSNQSMIACANGVLAKRQEDCPPVLTTSSQLSDTSTLCYTIKPDSTSPSEGNPVLSVASLMSDIGGNASPSGSPSSSLPSTMASFTANMPSLSSTAVHGSTTASLIASIICADGSSVIRTQDCLNGLFELSESPSLLAFRTSPAPVMNQAVSTATNVAGSGNIMLNNIVANAVLALSNVPGLTGGILNTVIADLSSAIQAANTLPGSLLPSGGAVTIAAPGGVSAIAVGVAQTISGQALSPITGGTLAVAGPGILASARKGQTPPTNVNTVAGNSIAAAGNIIEHFETAVTGLPTLFPIVTTVLNGKPSTVPVVAMAMAGNPTALPLGADGARMLAGLNGSLVKGRRRLVNRDEPEVRLST